MSDIKDSRQVIDGEHNPPERGFFGSLKDSSLQRFAAATLFWGTGHQLINVAQGYLMFELTGSTVWLGALGAAIGIPNLVMGVVGGLLADRVSRTRLLMIGSAVTGLPMLAIALLYAADILEPWHLVVAAVAQGTGLSIDWISRLSLLPDVVPKNILVRAISIDQSAFNAARVSGPLIGGFILGASGASAAYGAIAALFGLAFLAYTTFRPHTQSALQHSSGIVEDLREVVSEVRGNSLLGMNLAFTAVNALVLGGMTFMIPAFAKEIFVTDETGLGYLFAAVGIGAVGGAITMSLTGGLRKAGLALLITNLLFGGFVIAWSHTNVMMLAMAFAFMLGYFNSIHVALGIAGIHVNVPAKIRGRVIGAYEIAWSGFPLGGLASGSLATVLGLSGALTVLAVGLITFTLIVAAFNVRFRQSIIDIH